MLGQKEEMALTGNGPKITMSASGKSEVVRYTPDFTIRVINVRFLSV